MKKISQSVICIIIGALFFLSCSKKDKTVANYGVIPLPQETVVTNGQPFILKGSTKITYPKGDNDMERIADFLSEYIAFETEKNLAISDAKANENEIILRSNLSNTNKEAYSLIVTSDSIVINGASPAGVFYGIQTLRKSIDLDSENKNIEFPSVEINDYPRFAYRGMHLDVARHMFSISFIKKYIDILALHNINKFHWHLTDDQGWRIEIKKYPELAKIGSVRKRTVIDRNTDMYDETSYGTYYTQEQIKDIVKYAQDRFITIIPEIDLPGHMLGALAAYPQLGCTGGPYEVEGNWGVFEDVLCAGNDSVYPFLENIFTEVMELFPSEFIHIGGDECPKTRWEKCAKCQTKIRELGLKSDKSHTAEEKLQSYMITTVEKFLNEHGRKIIGWDEILEGGLAPNATVMSWRGVEGAVSAARQGNDAILTPYDYMYFNCYQTANTEDAPLAIGGFLPLEKVYGFEPIVDGLSEQDTKHIIGVQANLWTEYIQTSDLVEYMVMPRIAALAEVQWTMPSKKEYKSFLERLKHMFNIYDKLEYKYSKSIYEVQSSLEADSVNNAISLSLTTIDNAPIYYTLDDSTPTDSSLLYKEPIKIKETTTVKAIAKRDNIETPIFVKDFKFNKATMKSISVNETPHSSYTVGGVASMIDGIYGNKENYRNGAWIGFDKGDLEITIDLQKIEEISEVDINTYVFTQDWIFGITRLTVLVSEDGVKYKQVALKNYKLPSSNIEDIIRNDLAFKPTKAQFVKLKINKVNKIPSWHPGAGKPAFLFIDEIIIN